MIQYIRQAFSKDIDVTIIRNTLSINLNKVVSDLINTKYNKGEKLRSESDITALLSHKDIEVAFTETLLNMYKIGAQADMLSSKGNFPFYEIMSSYISLLYKLRSRFMKELSNLYSRDSIDSEVFGSPKKVVLIKEYIEELISKVVEMLISSSGNIYSSMNYKYGLLNFS
jgi:hypothetical protein